MSETAPVVTGLIGYGLAGASFHAPVISGVPGLTLAAIATRRDIGDRWTGARRVADAQAILADPAIELVVIASPSDTHADLAERALAAGKHVVVDKPLATDPADAERLVALADDAGRVLAPFHNRRWDSDFRTVARLMADGVLGEVLRYEARWDRYRPAIKPGWREEPGAGAGILTDLGPHLIDQALVLFGMPDAVTADIATQRAAGVVDDYFELTLHYGTARAILSTSSLAAAPRPRFALHGTRGSFVKYGLDPQEAALRAGALPGDAGYGIEPAEQDGSLTIGEAPATTVRSEAGDYRGFYAGVAAAIRNGAPPPVDPRDAVAGLRLMALAREAAATGRTLPVPAQWQARRDR